ncbi:Na+/H+ antiporter [Dictyobacter formicarum]|uniref:Na+/H+ antiporter n=1 Tax=Dictyobacter formicarum TaxID=2778368 RepID=A0ABQ3VDL9_9CHLR|nr:Na+/H+ antiporter [Dictyobacter formicarum]GHO84237.1 Na+/H+ antiporter [Dictyobacter formicarum]
MLSFTSLTGSFVQGNGPSLSSIIILILGLLVTMVVLAIIAPRLRIPYPILLVLGGLLIGFVPGLPRFTSNPGIVFLLFLPPLLYSSAWLTSWRDFRANLRPISLLALGLVLLTTVVVAVVAHGLIPGLPWAVAFVLGAIVSPTDTVAATAITQRLGIPQRIVTILEGESLVNDATSLVAYRFAVAAVVSGVFSPFDAGVQFVVVSVGGIALGLVAGWSLSYVSRWLNNPPLEITVTLVTPFAVYLLGQEVLQVSGVLATVTTGLYLTWRAPTFFSSGTRLQTYAVWETLIFLLNGLLFILMGLQLPAILAVLNSTTVPYSHIPLVWHAVLISLTVILVRLVWVFLQTLLPRMISHRLRERDPYPGWRFVVLIGWTGMRGALSLAAALALPEVTTKGAVFPGRELVIYLTFSVILATLVAQGLSLPLLIRGLGLHDDGASERQEMQARLIAAQAALARLDELASQDEVSQEVVQHLRTYYEIRVRSLTKRFKQAEGEPGEDLAITHQQLQREILQVERSAVIGLRNRGEINDEVLRRIERELDLEEQRLAGEAGKA